MSISASFTLDEFVELVMMDGTEARSAALKNFMPRFFAGVKKSPCPPVPHPLAPDEPPCPDELVASASSVKIISGMLPEEDEAEPSPAPVLTAKGGGKRATKWSPDVIRALIARRDAGEKVTKLAKELGVSPAFLYQKIRWHLEQNASDGPAKAADRAACIMALRNAAAPITVLDDVVRYQGRVIDDAELLELANAERRRARLPLLTLAV